MTRNRTQLLLQLAAAFLLVLGVQARTWTSADGSKTFEGELQSYDAASGKVSVTLPNGKRMAFLQEKLSAEDIAWLKKNGNKPAAGKTAEVKELPDELPDPDGEEADMSKPVQVYILLGQSNMLGAGKIKGGGGSLEHAVKEKKLYPYLADDEGNWTERKDVRNVRVKIPRGGGMMAFYNEFMTIKSGNIGPNIGPEIGIGHYVGHVTDAPVMILKSCTGNRALGWDLLPPGSESFEFTDAKGKTWVHPGYKGSPERWEKGTQPKRIGWYAGKQYDDDTASLKKALEDLDTYYPGAKEYEIAGFFWWQGDRDSRSAALSGRYEKNLVHLIKQLRKDFKAPNAKFVCASLGQTKKGATDGGGKILDAMLAVDGDSGKYPEFKGNVASVYAHPLSKGGSSGGHYGGNAETYMNVGEAMGRAMVELLKADK
jgi:hypothetical protein